MNPLLEIAEEMEREGHHNWPARIRAYMTPERAAFIEAAEDIRAALRDACTLMHGWHADGTDWSEWDEWVYKKTQAALDIVQAEVDRAMKEAEK